MFCTKKIPFFQSYATWPVNMTTTIVICLGFLIPYAFNNVFSIMPPPVIYIPIAIAVIADYCLVAQFSKVAYIRVAKS
ncbi:hypothetical protein [Spiroplasma mirum]|nr:MULTISPECIES: hypothetical protein [Spiroplasma]